MALYFNLHTRMFVQEVAIMNGRKIFYLFHFIVFHIFFLLFYSEDYCRVSYREGLGRICNIMVYWRKTDIK